MEIVTLKPARHHPDPVETAWSAAAVRVECYLRAHGLADAAHVSRLAADIIALAQARPRPGVDPVTRAMETVEACLAAWLARLLPGGETADATNLARGRLALAMGEVPARWPEHFLSETAVPVELVRALREADLGRAPEVHLTHMAPPPATGPLAAGVRLRWQVSYRWPFLRVVSGLVMAVSLLGAALTAGL